MRCPKCDHEIKADRNFIWSCENCGYNTISKKYQGTYCKACKEGIPKNKHICIYCGFDNFSGEYTNKCVACGKSVVRNEINSCAECAEKVKNIYSIISSINSFYELFKDELITRSQYKEKVIEKIERDVSEKLIKSDVKFYLKWFKEMILKGVLSDDDYKDISELILNKYSNDLNEKKSFKKNVILKQNIIINPDNDNNEKVIKSEELKIDDVKPDSNINLNKKKGESITYIPIKQFLIIIISMFIFSILFGFSIAMLQAITIGIGFMIGYFLNKDSVKFWRVFVGLLLGFVVSWLLGVIIWAFVFISGDFTDAILAGMTKSFLFAIVGGGMGVYFGRRKAKLANHT